MKKLHMVQVDGGYFLMGLQVESVEQALELYHGMLHTVKVPDFLISRNLVSQQSYAIVMGNDPFGDRRDDDAPMTGISWSDAIRFCNGLSRVEGRETAYAIDGDEVSCNWNAKGYRLPTEAEWEFVARGGVFGKPRELFSDKFKEKLSGGEGPNDKHTGNVVTKRNKLGVRDMICSVWQWCWDWYGENYYEHAPVYHPKGPDTGAFRVIRGCVRSNGLNNGGLGQRQYAKPGTVSSEIGFRVVLCAY